MKRNISMAIIFCFMLLLVACNNPLYENSKNISNEDDTFQRTVLPDENISSFKDRKIIADNILIQVNDMIVTRGLPETVEKYKIDYFDEICGEDGTFEKDYQYVFLDLTLENKSGIIKEMYLNSILMSHLDDNNSFRGPTEEMRYRSGYDFEGISPKDYFCLTLDINEIVDVTVGFIVEDTFFDTPHSCLRINISGNFYSSEIKSIRLTNEE